MIRFPFTFAAVILVFIILLAALFGHINLIQLPAGLFARIEATEIDDIVTAIVLVGVAFAVDQVLARRRGKRDAELLAERVRVVQVTMRTVQDIVNNSLNGLQLLRLDAEGHVPSETLILFDEAIRETTAKLKALGDLQEYAEKQIGFGAALDISNLQSV